MKRRLRNAFGPNGGSHIFLITSIGENHCLDPIAWIGIPRGRDQASDRGNNLPFRRAVCEKHKYGSVGGARGNSGCLHLVIWFLD